MTGIYCITNTKNQHKYIGSSRNMGRRQAEHFYDLRKKKHRNPYLQNAYNKYGEKYFTFSTLEVCKNEISEKELMEKEDSYIKSLSSMAHHGGYNLLKADRRIITERCREILLAANKLSQLSCNKIVYQYNLGGDFIAEYASVNLAAKHLFPTESMVNITKARRGSAIAANAREKRKSAFGFIWTYNKHKKIAAVNTKPAKVPVFRKCLTDNTVTEYESMAEAARAIGKKTTTIYQSIYRKNIVAKKYRFGIKEQND